MRAWREHACSWHQKAQGQPATLPSGGVRAGMYPYGSQGEDCVHAKACDTSVQYAAYRISVSFDSDYSGEDGPSPLSFFHQWSICSSYPVCAQCSKDIAIRTPFKTFTIQKPPPVNPAVRACPPQVRPRNNSMVITFTLFIGRSYLPKEAFLYFFKRRCFFCVHHGILGTLRHSLVL